MERENEKERERYLFINHLNLMILFDTLLCVRWLNTFLLFFVHIQGTATSWGSTQIPQSFVTDVYQACQLRVAIRLARMYVSANHC